MKTLLTTIAIGLLLLSAGRAEPSVQASLSESSAQIDQPVQLRIEVQNARIAAPPRVVASGLTITFAGQSIGVRTMNSQTTTTTLFSYIVTASTAGTFAIPPIDINIGGRTYQTPKLTLQVAQDAPDRKTSGGKLYFAELIVPKDSVYVGEQIPIELRFYFDRRVWYEPYPQGQLPIIDGDGFVTKKYATPAEKQQTLDGREYQVLIYKTAITGVKTGRLDLHSAYQEFMVRLPAIQRNPPGFDDFSDQTPFPNPFDTFERKDVKISSSGVSIDVKPLPEAGRPPNFSGAIGQFNLAALVQPTKTGVGDPVTLKVQVEGLGNFDRMGPPVLTQTTGWRTYQPTNETEILDDVGMSALKTFTYAIVPVDKVSQAPIAEFSYFDPETGKYVTVHASPLALEVEGRPIPQVAPPVGGPSPTIQTTPTPAPPLEVLDIRTSNSRAASFVPLIRQPIFWIGQAVPGGAFLLFGLALWFRNLQASTLPIRPFLKERAALRRELNSAEPEQLFAAATRLLELDVLIKARGSLRNLPIEDALQRKQISSEFRAELDRLVEKRARLRYGHLVSEPITKPEREEIKSLIRRWEVAS
ncbi:MAG: BatD family protein [Chthoniobacterales bacterium]